MAYTKQALDDPRVKILGLCFGHQIVGRALGAEGAKSDKGYEMSVCDVQLSEVGHRIFGKPELVGATRTLQRTCLE